jgi:hypothetical protein
VQAGLTHDRYWKDNVLHVGGSYSFARATRESPGQRDLHSLNLGATLVLSYHLQRFVGRLARSGARHFD